MWQRIRNEPALVAGVVAAAIALAVSFGLNLSTAQIGTINAFVAAVLAVVVRTKVTPAHDVQFVDPDEWDQFVDPAAHDAPGYAATD
jgi:hypothetical protein